MIFDGGRENKRRIDLTIKNLSLSQPAADSSLVRGSQGDDSATEGVKNSLWEFLTPGASCLRLAPGAPARPLGIVYPEERKQCGEKRRRLFGLWA